LKGDTAFVGSRSANILSNAGEVHIFEYSDGIWTQSKVFGPDDIIDWMGFGYALSVEGNELIVGAEGDDHTLTDAGSFYCYKLAGSVNWTNIASDETNDGIYSWTLPNRGNINYSVRVRASDLVGNSTCDISDNVFTIKVPISEIELTTPTGNENWSAEEIQTLTWNTFGTGSDISGIDLAYSTDTLLLKQIQKFQPDDLAKNDFFGISVSIDGNYALVGAYGDDNKFSNAGAVYYLKWDGTEWYEIDKFYADNAEENDFFGISVALDGNKALIGAYGEDVPYSSAGAVYYFEHDGNTWNQIQKLQSNDIAELDRFGTSVALDGEKALIGAMFESGTYSKAGAVYYFKYIGNSWTQIQKFQSEDIEKNDRFGISVALDGENALIGAHQEDTTYSNAGSVYYFNWNGTSWEQADKLQPHDIKENNRFGRSISIDGKRALVGAIKDNGGTTNAGSVYTYELKDKTWTQSQEFYSNDIEENDNFGNSVALDGNKALVGANAEDAIASNGGALYAFELGKNNTWIDIVTSETNDGTYDWTLPNATGVKYSIRAKAVNNLGITSYDIASPVSVDNSAPSQPIVNNYNDGVITNDSTPTLNFDLSDRDNGDLIKYQIQIDNNGDFASPEVDYTEVGYTASPRVGAEFISPTLISDSYYWRVRAIDDSGSEGFWKTVRTF